MGESPLLALLWKEKLATTIVALAAIGETNTAKVKHFALHAARRIAVRGRPRNGRLNAPERDAGELPPLWTLSCLLGK